MKGNAYSISEMAAMFGLTRQTLIYYDRIGLFAPAHVNEEGYRLYEPTQIPFFAPHMPYERFGPRAQGD